MARFGQALKPPKAPQQLSKALAPHNPPLALPSYLPIGPTNCFYWASKLLHGTFWAGLKTSKTRAAAFESLGTAQPSAALPSYVPIGSTNCFYWASKLLQGTFWAGLKTAKTRAQPSKALAPHNPPLALPSYLTICPTNCFYWASKLLHGTFWAGLKTSKSPAAAFESLSTAQPSACFAIVPPLRNCYMARFGQALKPPKPLQQLSKALAPHNPPLALPSYLPIGPTNCFYWASKLLHGTFLGRP